jgi:NDP-sugar pyrophosphorylase family protein
MDFTYLVGPVHVGERSRIIERASLKENVCVGRTCKIGGLGLCRSSWDW